MFELPVETILSPDSAPPVDDGETIGYSREGRPLWAVSRGRGPLRCSLIGGCHADEPVGPQMLRLLAHHLGGLPTGHPLVEDLRWLIVPHVNPDGERRNAAWSDHPVTTTDHRQVPDRGYDPVLYVQQVVRELPGDDIEFGFPRDVTDLEARPENRAVADFLGAAGPVHLHGSFHGMGLAPGPWFLIESGWVDRTAPMREALRQQVRAMGYPLFDVDRQGEKGFHRIDEGFATRPDSRAMRDHFLARDDRRMAAKFRPSSMELARRLGGDPLTLVSEMPLFLMPAATDQRPGPPGFRAGTAGKRHLHDQLRAVAADLPASEARAAMARLGIRAMPIRDQMRLQLAFLEQAISAVRGAFPAARRG